MLTTTLSQKPGVYLHAFWFALGTLSLFALLTTAAIAQQESPPPPSYDAKKGIPSERLEFTSPNEDFPPKPKGYPETKLLLNPQPLPPLTAERQREVESVARTNARVLQALGRRFVHISTGTIQEGKSRADTSTAVRVRFFAYQTGTTVDVIVGPGNTVQRVDLQAGLQPPETAEEIKAAQDIVLRASPQRDRLAGLNVAGILSDPGAIGLAASQRIIYLTFNSPANDIIHVAWVNLTTQQLVREGPPPTKKR